MRVTATDAFLDREGRRRGRLCRRPDGLWMFVTEYLTDETEECWPYWINDYPPSGLYRTRDDAAAALRAALGDMISIENVRPVVLDTVIGPYPEPSV
jgi:hypothetical protein